MSSKIKMVDIPDPTEDNLFVQEDTSNFHEITGLPSKGLLYPKNTVIKGRPFTVKEVKRLATMNENNFQVIIKDVLTNSIRGIKGDDILVADKIYLIFWLRANTYKDAHFSTPFVCEHCGREGTYLFDVDGCEFTYLDESVISNGLQISMLNGHTLSLKYLTVSDEDKIKAFRNSLKSGLSQYDELDIAIGSMIRLINDKPVSLRSACEYLGGIDPSSWAQLNTYINKIDFGIRPVIEAKCNHADCQEVSEVQVSFRPDFFIPEYNA